MARSALLILCLTVALGNVCSHGDGGARRLFQVTAANITNATLPNATLVSALNATLPPRLNVTLPTSVNTTLLSAGNGTANTSLVNSTYIPLSNSSRYQIFDVTGFGAKGDGVANDTQAVISTIRAACALNGTTGVIRVPNNRTFLVASIALKGCANVVFEIMGTIVAYPYGSPSWPAKPQGLFYLQSFSNWTIQGNGTLDGTGYDWWLGSLNSSNTLVRPDILHLDTGANLLITGIKLVNSPQVALYLKGFKGVVIDRVTILAPEWSPNTDGIDLTTTSNATITNCYIDTGDDNVALKQGCNGVVIKDTYCGHGHGASIGSLGDSGLFSTVSNVVVNNITFNNTLYAARIKTFPKCQGSVTNVTFSNLAVTNVTIPIYIEQQYCCQSACSNNSAAVVVSGITYANITGTVSPTSSRTIAGDFNCDANSPCKSILLNNINLRAASTNGNAASFAPCNWIQGTASGAIVPSLGNCQGFVNATSTS